MFFSFTKLANLCLKKTNTNFFLLKIYVFLQFIIQKKPHKIAKVCHQKKSLLIIRIQLETEKPDLSKKYAISLTRSIVQFDYIFTYILRFHFCPTPLPPPPSSPTYQPYLAPPTYICTTHPLITYLST